MNKHCFIFFAILFGFNTIRGNEVEEQLSSPGKYSQWREKIPIQTEGEVPDCKGKCNERCGATHKGVSICASLFEYADTEPQDPKSEVIF